MGLAEDLGFQLSKKRAGANGKVKGAQNELVAAEKISLWTGYKFARVPGSGGLRWKNAADTIGDITSEDRSFNFAFTVEAKFYKDFDIPNFTVREAVAKRSKLITFFRQAYNDAERAGKIPLLVARKNGMKKGEFIVGLLFSTFKLLDSLNKLDYYSIGYFKPVEKELEAVVFFDSIHLWKIPYADFAKIYQPITPL